jgi:hypothetical protein
MIRCGSSRLVCVSPVSPFLVIFGAFAWNFCGEVLGAFLWGILVGCHIWGSCASLLGDLAPIIPLKRLRLGCFRWFSWEGGLEGWLPIPLDWVGFGDRASSEKWRTRYPSYPKVSLWSVERIGRSTAWKVEFFPRAEFFLTVQAKPAWPVSQTGLTGLALWAVVKGFWAGRSLSC